MLHIFYFMKFTTRKIINTDKFIQKYMKNYAKPMSIVQLRVFVIEQFRISKGEKA